MDAVSWTLERSKGNPSASKAHIIWIHGSDLLEITDSLRAKTRCHLWLTSSIVSGAHALLMGLEVPANNRGYSSSAILHQGGICDRGKERFRFLHKNVKCE